MTKISSYKCDICGMDGYRDDQVTGIEMRMDGLAIDVSTGGTHICKSCMGAIAEHVKPVSVPTPHCGLCCSSQRELMGVTQTVPGGSVAVNTEGPSPDHVFGPIISYICKSCYIELGTPVSEPNPEDLALLLKHVGVALGQPATRTEIAKKLIKHGVRIVKS